MARSRPGASRGCDPTLRGAVKRVLVLSPGDAELSQTIGQSQLEAAAISTDIQFDITPVRIWPQYWDSYHDWFLGEAAYFEAGINAERDGYAAVVVLSAGDMSVRNLRSVMSIPVVGGGRITYLMALELGTRFSLLIQHADQKFFYANGIREYGLEHRCASIRPTGIDRGDRAEQSTAEYRREVLLPRILEIADEAIRIDGADVLCVAVHFHWAQEAIREATGVPVLSSGPLALRLVETLLALGHTHSPIAYQRPAGPEPDIVHAMLTAAVAARNEQVVQPRS
jgi:allantoin racemase